MSVSREDIKDLREQIDNLEYKYQPLTDEWDREEEFRNFCKDNLAIVVENGLVKLVLLREGKQPEVISYDAIQKYPPLS